MIKDFNIEEEGSKAIHTSHCNHHRVCSLSSLLFVD